MSLLTLARRVTLPSAALAVALFAWSPARAATQISVSSLSADGLEVQDLVCEVDSGGFLASALIVGALAGQKAALARCGPSGEAARLSFVFNAASTSDIKVLGASNKAAGACIAKALKKVKPPTTGSCTATILTAPNDKARAAAAALSPKKTAPATTEPDKATPTKTAEVDTSAAGLLKFYGDDDHWTALSNEHEGWEFWVPKGADFEDASLVHGDDRWVGVEASHAHQLAWLFRHPTAALTPKVVEDITARCLAKAKALEWSVVVSRPAEGDKPEMVVDKAFLSPHRFIRFVARGTRESVIVVAAFLEQMPDDIVLKWINSVKFWAPVAADVEK